jgi:hypothetical protein
MRFRSGLSRKKVGVSAGEIIEGAAFVFNIKDVTNRLDVVYSLSAVGLANPGLPGSVSLVGKPVAFNTDKLVKVTNFGPIGGIASLALRAVSLP